MTEGSHQSCGSHGARTVDWILDRTVLPGFSSIGWRLRGLSSQPADPDGRLRGADVVVTGASSGIGEAAARAFADLGARVHVVVRNRERGEAAIARIVEATGSEDVTLHLCDVSSLDSVRALVPELSESFGDRGLRALVHNAGVLLQERQSSVDGFELTLATHVLGPLLMTELLAPALAAGAPSKVIFVTSGGMYTERLRVDDLELESRDFDGPAFYAHAKRIQVILTGLLDARFAQQGTTVHAMHPGWVDTPGVVEALPRFHSTLGPILRSDEQGADTIVWLAASAAADECGGRLWMDRRVRPEHRVPWTRETAVERARMWSRLAEMAQISPSDPAGM